MPFLPQAEILAPFSQSPLMRFLVTQGVLRAFPKEKLAPILELREFGDSASKRGKGRLAAGGNPRGGVVTGGAFSPASGGGGRVVWRGGVTGGKEWGDGGELRRYGVCERERCEWGSFGGMT